MHRNPAKGKVHSNTGITSRNNGRRIKSTKLEMKMEKSQQTTQKYKGSLETTINNYMRIKRTTWKKWTYS